jgi:very-short-patch-repair endonuclease
MTPDNYAVVYSDNSRRIFVVISKDFGDFVLTKDCKGEGCWCIGCSIFQATIVSNEKQYPIVDIERGEKLEANLMAYPFTKEGGAFLFGLKSEYKRYKGTVTKLRLDEIFKTPDALLIVKTEPDGTFTHSYMSSTIERRVISKGCKSGTCPCVGCRIVDMHYAATPDQVVPAIDRSKARSTQEGELVLPIFEGEEIISKLLNRDPTIRHDYPPNIFGSPLEKMFYELAFLDLHLYPQHKVGKYSLDFAIPDKMIAIELDGHEYHKTKYQRTHDAQRDRWLYGQGWHVLRFTGTEIYKNLDKCISEICLLAGVDRVTNASS